MCRQQSLGLKDPACYGNITKGLRQTINLYKQRMFGTKQLLLNRGLQFSHIKHQVQEGKKPILEIPVRYCGSQQIKLTRN